MLKKDAGKLNEQNSRKGEVQAKFSLAPFTCTLPHAHELRDENSKKLNIKMGGWYLTKWGYCKKIIGNKAIHGEY